MNEEEIKELKEEIRKLKDEIREIKAWIKSHEYENLMDEQKQYK
jgi:hypothetical protein